MQLSLSLRHKALKAACNQTWYPSKQQQQHWHANFTNLQLTNAHLLFFAFYYPIFVATLALQQILFATFTFDKTLTVFYNGISKAKNDRCMQHKSQSLKEIPQMICTNRQTVIRHWLSWSFVLAMLWTIITHVPELLLLPTNIYYT